MTFLCCCKCCSYICKCLQYFVDYCFFNWFSVACFGCCCCLFGMAVMLLITYLYYSVAIFPSATVEPSTVYEYEHEYPMYKRDAESDSREAYVEDVEENYSYVEPGMHKHVDEYEIARNKRDNQTSTESPTTTAKTQVGKSTNNTDGKQTTSKKGSEKNSKNGKATTQGPSTEAGGFYKEPGEEDLDFKLSNSFVNSIHAEAELTRMKEPLGLCRHNEEIKTPEMNITLFPVQQAEEIIMCINDILKNQSKKRLCIELNEEMNAFLKWLILTGESRERRKQIKITAYQDDFLFPTTCGTMPPLELPITEGPQPAPLPVGPVPLGAPMVTRSQAAGKQEAVLTTCAPVLQPDRKYKSKR